MARIDLPGGAWADLRDNVRQAPRKLYKPVQAAQAKLATLPQFAAIAAAAKNGDPSALENDIDPADIPAINVVMDDMREALIVALVTEWSFDLPVSVESLGELSEEVFDALAAAADERSAPAEAGKAELLDPTPEPAALSA